MKLLSPHRSNPLAFGLWFLMTTTPSIKGFSLSTTTTTATTSSSTTRFHSATVPLHVSSEQEHETTQQKADEDAQKLLDRAAQLRAEIAAMEGKTTEQVQAEADEKRALERQRLDQQEQDRAARKSKSNSDSRNKNNVLVQLPNTIDDMIRQAARAVERASKDGKQRQTVRFQLVTSEQSVTEENEWPGGAQQMYREAGKPLTNALLRELRLDSSSTENASLLPATIRNQDIWDFDGSALHTAEAAQGPKGDVKALVFPNTDTKYLKDIQTISDDMGPDRLFLLVNPFWRNIDSWSFNLLAPKAREKAQAAIFDQGYDETYHLLVFQVRGEKCAAVKAYPYDWEVFALLENPDWGTEDAIRLGTLQESPTSTAVTELLNARPEFKETKTMRHMKNLF